LILVSSSKAQDNSQKSITSQRDLHKKDKNDTNREEISVDFIVYRLMINVKMIDELSVQLYGSFRGGYHFNPNHLDKHSITESSIRKNPPKSGFAS
jgi:hypothetical protein